MFWIIVLLVCLMVFCTALVCGLSLLGRMCVAIHEWWTPPALPRTPAERLWQSEQYQLEAVRLLFTKVPGLLGCAFGAVIGMGAGNYFAKAAIVALMAVAAWMHWNNKLPAKVNSPA